MTTLAIKTHDMSYVRIWLHCVWGTKRREHLITKELHYKLLNHIREKAKEKNIFIDTINAHLDHVHCLLSLQSTQCISKIMNQIKGESSYWINKENLSETHFEWAVKYFSISVSDSHVNKVRRYIKNQQQHHAKKTWLQESEEYIEVYGFANPDLKVRVSKTN